MLRWMAIGLVLMTLLSITPETTQSYRSSHVLAPDAHSTADLSDPPTIDWIGPSGNETMEVGLLVDGSYLGQTEQAFGFTAWVNDSDGVDSVMFKFLYRGDWTNQTATQIEGDELGGRYSGRLVCDVEWDWANWRPNPGGHSFQVGIFANDSLGNWVETASYSESYGYYFIFPPFPFWLVATPIGWLIIGVSAVGVVITIRRKHRSRQKSPELGDSISLQ